MLFSSFVIDWLPMVVAFGVSAVVTALLVLAGVKVGRDKAEGIQKFHTKPTSRLGGIGIILGLLAGIYVASATQPKDGVLGLWLLFCSLPVFAGGLVEDLTHMVSPRVRLILACISSASIYFVFQLGVTRTDIQLLDWALTIPGITLLLTVLVVAGFINAINIIDGFHGLASSAVIIMMLGIAALAWLANDGLVFRISLIAAVSTLGFFCWNWPFGKIFLGDGGAYLLGFLVVELGLLLPHRSLDISPMAPVLIGVYPLLETLYSMYRRKFIRSHPVNHPDAMHLHTLIYRRLILNPSIDVSMLDKNKANSKVAVIICGFVSMPVCLAIAFRQQTTILLALIIIHAILYYYFYKLLLTFKSPRIFMSKSRRAN